MKKIIEESRKAALILDLDYMVKSSATTGAYNSSAIRGVPSLLIERGGRGTWSKEEVNRYKKDVRNILNYLNVLKDSDIKCTNSPYEIKQTIYLNSKNDGCWYPEVKPGDRVKSGDLIGVVKDYFGQELSSYYSEIDGVILYMTVSLSVEEGESLIAYGR